MEVQINTQPRYSVTVQLTGKVAQFENYDEALLFAMYIEKKTKVFTRVTDLKPSDPDTKSRQAKSPSRGLQKLRKELDKLDTPPRSDTTSNSELREQLEEFALHLKPGTTKGKHRTAIFDTLELTKLVQALLAQEANKARLDEINKLFEWIDVNDAQGFAAGSIPELVLAKRLAILKRQSLDLKAQNRSNDE